MAMEIKPTARQFSIFSATSLTSAATAVSSGVDATNSSYFGLWIKASSVSTSGVTGVRLWYEESYNDVDENYVVPDTIGDILTGAVVGRSEPRIVNMGPLPMEYIRFKATVGSASCPADTILTVKLFTQ